MEQELEKKVNFVEKLKDFYIKQRKKIFFFIFILLAILISAFFIKNNQSKKNVLISEKYIQAGVYLSAGKRDEAIFIYKDIISTKNNFRKALFQLLHILIVLPIPSNLIFQSLKKLK